MRSKITIFIVLLALWVNLSGYWTPLLLSLGVLSALITVLLIARMQTVEEWLEEYPIKFYVRMTLHYVRLLWEMFVAAVMVVRLVFKRRYRPQMSFLIVPATATTALGQLVRANSVTLTPGTISVTFGIGYILIHVLHTQGHERKEQIELDQQVSRLES